MKLLNERMKFCHTLVIQMYISMDQKDNCDIEMQNHERLLFVELEWNVFFLEPKTRKKGEIENHFNDHYQQEKQKKKTWTWIFFFKP
jgi:hypothetical protein